MQITLRDKATGDVHEIRTTDGLIGRDPVCAIVFSGDAAKTVSAKHARVFTADGQWWIEDAGSRNGTFVDDKRLEAGARKALTKSRIIRFGAAGPRLEVTETRAPAQPTMIEAPPPVVAPPRQAPPPPPPPRPQPAALAQARAPSSSPEPTPPVQSPQRMSRAAAEERLQLPPRATPDQIRQQYQSLYSEFQVRVTNAPTPVLRRRYEEQLREVQEAYDLLGPAAGHAAAGPSPRAAPAKISLSPQSMLDLPADEPSYLEPVHAPVARETPDRSEVVDRKQSAPAEEEMRRCPHCAETILAAARVCKHCGRNVTPIDQPKSGSGGTVLVLFILALVIGGALAVYFNQNP